MAIENKITRVISKLNRLTQEGTLKWGKMDPPRNIASGSENIIASFYGTNYEGRNIGIYEERYRAYDSSSDEPYWTNQVTLAFFSNAWEEEWQFPKVHGLYELLESIQYQSSNVEGFIDSILDEGDQKSDEE